MDSVGSFALHLGHVFVLVDTGVWQVLHGQSFGFFFMILFLKSRPDTGNLFHVKPYSTSNIARFDNSAPISACMGGSRFSAHGTISIPTGFETKFHGLFSA